MNVLRDRSLKEYENQVMGKRMGVAGGGGGGWRGALVMCDVLDRGWRGRGRGGLSVRWRVPETFFAHFTGSLECSHSKNTYIA